VAHLVPWRGAAAQRDIDTRLGRLDSTTRLMVAAVVDSARRTRLPTEPLVDKALEGAQKGADGGRIVTAVRGLYAELRSARAALGAGATTDEINAGANAIHAGLPMRNLSQLRAAAQHAGRARVTLPLTVYADLIARGVPTAVASDVVLSLARAGLRDGDYAMFERNVRLDIENGADAATAAQTRARGAALHNAGR
jgi:alkylhydroperoxidase/carboxymuconolactone decarboxylase family protein YurZ